MIKKLFVLMFGIILLAGVISSAEFDNSKSYDDVTKTATVTNLFGLGDEIARIRLGSPLDLQVPTGEEVLVAWYELENLKEYDGLEVFGIVETLDLKRGNSPITKNIVFKEKIISMEEFPNYITTCSGTKTFYSNGTEIQECSTIQDGVIEKEIEEWRPINKNSLLEIGNKTIGLFTEVEIGESVEWIPTMYGISIEEWASWTQSLESGLLAYWKLDETTGTIAEDDLGVIDLTVDDSWITGLINNGNLFNGTAGSNTGYKLDEGTGFSLNFWIKNDGVNPTGYMAGTQNNGTSSSAGFFMQVSSTMTAVIYNETSSSLQTTSSISDTEFQMITLIIESGSQKIYTNGTEEDSDNVTFSSFSSSSLSMFDFQVGGGQLLGHSNIDEIGIWDRVLTQGEITNLYNDGLGITRTATSNVVSLVLDAPPNNTIIYSAGAGAVDYYSADFTAQFSELVNTTLNIWNSSNDLVKTNFTLITGVSNFTNLTIGGLSNGVHYWNYEVCGTNATFIMNCSVGSTNRSLDVRVLRENDYSYNSSTIEGREETFLQNITINEALTITQADLIHNNTRVSGTSSLIGEDYILSKTSYVIPPVNSVSNVSFFWSVILSNGENINLTNYTQSINLVNVTASSSCASGLDPAMVWDFKHEANLTNTTGNVNYNFKYGISNNTFKSIYGSLTNAPALYLCINSSFSNDYGLGYGEIQYSKEGYSDRRFYTFSNQRLTNTTINNTLHFLPNGDSTSFLFEFKDTSLAPYVDKYTTLLRWYPELDEYKVVEMAKTDDKGQTIKRVKVEDVDYRVGLYHRNGSLITLLNPVRFACASAPCSYSSLVDTSESDYVSFFGVEGGINFNSTSNVFTLTWSDPSQNTESFNFIVTRERGDGSYTICDVSASGFTGVLNCDASGFTGTLLAQAYRTASPSTVIFSKLVNTITSPFSSGGVGLFMSFIIFALLMLIGIYSPIASVILGILALIPALYLGVITLAIFIAIAVLGGIAIHFMKRTG